MFSLIESIKSLEKYIRKLTYHIEQETFIFDKDLYLEVLLVGKERHHK